MPKTLFDWRLVLNYTAITCNNMRYWSSTLERPRKYSENSIETGKRSTTGAIRGSRFALKSLFIQFGSSKFPVLKYSTLVWSVGLCIKHKQCVSFEGWNWSGFLSPRCQSFQWSTPEFICHVNLRRNLERVKWNATWFLTGFAWFKPKAKETQARLSKCRTARRTTEFSRWKKLVMFYLWFSRICFIWCFYNSAEQINSKDWCGKDKKGGNCNIKCSG